MPPLSGENRPRHSHRLFVIEFVVIIPVPQIPSETHSDTGIVDSDRAIVFLNRRFNLIVSGLTNAQPNQFEKPSIDDIFPSPLPSAIGEGQSGFGIGIRGSIE